MYLCGVTELKNGTMNKRRRMSLNKAIDWLEQLQHGIEKDDVSQELERAYKLVESVHDEEEMAMDNIPEALQMTTMYENISENVDDLSDAIDNLDSIKEDFQNMDKYDYKKIKKDVVETIRLIHNVIYR